jgi:hypothetical protein
MQRSYPFWSTCPLGRFSNCDWLSDLSHEDAESEKRIRAIENSACKYQINESIYCKSATGTISESLSIFVRVQAADLQSYRRRNIKAIRSLGKAGAG